MLQNTEPNLRRFSVAKCSAAAVVKRSKISPSSPPTPPSLLPDDARRISCLDFYSSSSYLTLKGLTHLAFHRQIMKIIFQGAGGLWLHLSSQAYEISNKKENPDQLHSAYVGQVTSWRCHAPQLAHPPTCDLGPALEEGGEFVGGAEVPVARLALVDRAVGDVVGVLDQAQLAGPTVLQEEGEKDSTLFSAFFGHFF